MCLKEKLAVDETPRQRPWTQGGTLPVPVWVVTDVSRVCEINGNDVVASQDLARNDLINLNLFVSTGALVVGSGAMMGGLFGMNVDVEATTAAWAVGPFDKFTIVTGGILSFSSAVALFCY